MTDLRRVASSTVRVLGIDPGTRVLGYGVVDAERGRAPTLVDCGVVRLPISPLCERLETIFRRVQAVIREHNPRVLAIEEVFHGKNFQSVLKVGEARGVVVLAAQMAGLEIHEYSPARIKKAATGNGNADKSQVQSMMARHLGLDSAPEPQDITDALAAAFCHCQRRWRLVPDPGPRSKRRLPAKRSEDSLRRRRTSGEKGEEWTESGQTVRRCGDREKPAAAARPAAGKNRRSRSSAEGDDATLKALLGSGRARVLATGRFRRRGARGEDRKGGPPDDS